MRTLLIIACVLLLVLFGSTLFICRAPEVSWTTTSEPARDAFQRGLQEEMKLYLMEAQRHYREALQADPDFIAARTRLLDISTRLGGVSEEEILLLRGADLDTLEPREQFLTRHFLYRIDRNGKRSDQLTEEFLAAHPDDPFALSYAAEAAVMTGDDDRAEVLFQHLLEIEPNWVRAQNWLGYIAMTRGEFEEAERRFRTYQYIAPDQANPHDSMGELFLLLGRYEDAEAELEAALSLNPSFGASWGNLISSALLQQDMPRAELLLARATGTRDMLQGHLEEMRCDITYGRGALDDVWSEVVDDLARCNEDHSNAFRMLMQHRGLLQAGYSERALQMEQELAEFLEKRSNGVPRKRPSLAECSLLHMRGSREAVLGELEQAQRTLALADECLTYRSFREGLLKLNNRMARVLALEELNQAEEARHLEDAVRQVNPSYADLCRLLAEQPQPLDPAADLLTLES
ncbi:MAG: tetratricopeptide repeat protein [Acidobacteriota bacterium]